MFARLGAYDTALLDRLTFEPRGPHTEYWAHEAAFVRTRGLAAVPVADGRTTAARYGDARDGWFQRNSIDGRLAARASWRRTGPLAASEIEHDANTRTGPWWGWSDVKRALEHLFLFGEVAIAGRTRFQRRYALVRGRAARRASSTGRSTTADAVRELIRRSAVAHGIGTLGRPRRLLPHQDAPRPLAAIRELEDAGELDPGHRARLGAQRQARRRRGCTAMHGCPRRIEAAALLSPFDPVVWFRDRALRMFDFHYRIEIYTPAPKRVYGYYTLPILARRPASSGAST